MNVFGSFTFGSLIKTFLPGLMWLCGLVIFEMDIATWRGATSYAQDFMHAFPQAAIILAIPVSILLGVFSNVIVFMGLNDHLVRNPAKKSGVGSTTSELYELVCSKIREFTWEPIDTSAAPADCTSNACVDAEILVLNELGVAQLSFVREQYWYYVEFLMNLMLALWVLAAAFCLRFWITEENEFAFRASAMTIAVVCLLSWFLVRAARKNYCKHLAKMLSLILSVLSKQQRAEIAAARAKPATTDDSGGNGG